MAINLTNFTKNVDNIQRLSDKPNETDGLSAQGLKQRFDQAGVDIKAYLNGELIPELESILTTQEQSVKNAATNIETITESVDTINENVETLQTNLENLENNVATKANIIVYSQNKVDTGKRNTDGKVIYAASIPVTLHTTEQKIDASNLNIKKIISYSGGYSDGENDIPSNYYVGFYTASGFYDYFVSASKYNEFIYVRNSKEYAGFTGELIIEYTEKEV